MARKRKLDKWVTSFVDRHGKERFRFRRGRVSIYLPPLGSPEYRDAYEKAVKGTGQLERVKPKTIGDLVARYYRTIDFRQTGEAWQRTIRQSIEPFREEYGDDMVEDFRPKDIDKILEDRFEKRIVNGRPFGGSASAERLREMLMRLFKLAVRLEWLERNPVELSQPVKHKGAGFYPWTEEDVTQFRAHWPLGTKARLAMELMLWTGARRGDAHRMPPPKKGRFRLTAAKTGKEILLPVAPALQAAIDAMPSVGTETLIVTEFGKPFSRAGFGNKMREWCDAANLPQCTSHGLRKALARRAAEGGKVTQQSLRALGQWSDDKTARVYVESANQQRLAEDALGAVVAWEREQNIV